MDKLEEDFEAIYESMIGMLKPEYRLDWVEDAFVEGTVLYQSYERIWQAEDRICWRLGLECTIGDPDMGAILGGITTMKRDIGRRMFYLTLEYVKRGYQV